LNNGFIRTYYTERMCGRFRIAKKKEILEEAFGVDDGTNDEDWNPRYNVAPGQEIAIVRQDASSPVRLLTRARWGLIPSWAKDPSVGFKLINARSETAADMPAFREPLRLRRCLIPADGFYEWKREGKKKLPFCFTLTDEAVFAFAGLWDEWKSPLPATAPGRRSSSRNGVEGPAIATCSILTTTPNRLMQDIHDRMPVILEPDAYELWLDPGFKKVAELQPLLKPYPAEAMRRYRVSQRVNQAKNDDPECALAIDATESGPEQGHLFLPS
jgi:putative SOS response-associated peptidase YedK